LDGSSRSTTRELCIPRGSLAPWQRTLKDAVGQDVLTAPSDPKLNNFESTCKYDNQKEKNSYYWCW